MSATVHTGGSSGGGGGAKGSYGNRNAMDGESSYKKDFRHSDTRGGKDTEDDYGGRRDSHRGGEFKRGTGGRGGRGQAMNGPPTQYNTGPMGHPPMSHMGDFDPMQQMGPAVWPGSTLPSSHQR